MGPDETFLKLYRKIDKRYIAAFISAIISGVLAHGLALFNKYSFHDDTYSMFTVGATFTSGRYMLYEISNFIQTKTGGLFSTPLYEGMITIVFIACGSVLLVSLLKIQSKILCSLMAGFMVCFPVVAGMLGFMFTGCYYSCAVFFTILGAYLICRYKKWFSVVIGVILIGNSIGIYQAYIPIFLSVFFLHYILENFEMGGTLDNNKKLILHIPYYAIASIGSIGAYFFANNYELKKYGQSLSNYKGIDKMGQMTVEQFFDRVKLAYSRFLFPKQDLFPKITYKLYVAIVLLCLVLTAILVFIQIKKNVISALLIIASTAFLPLGINFAYIMINDEQSVGTLQSYGYVMVVIWFVLLLSRLEREKLPLNQYINIAGAVLILFMSFMYVRLDNVVYLKAEILKQRSLAYYTELVTQIKSTEGYEDNLPVAYIKNGDLNDATIQEIPVWDFFYVHPYCDVSYNINYAWHGYITYWLGFRPEEVDSTPFETMEEVLTMPTYPDSGSIRIIDGTVVVKLADEQEGD